MERKGVERPTRDLARQSAQAANQTVGTWIEAAIRAHATFMPPAGSAPQPDARTEILAAAQRAEVRALEHGVEDAESRSGDMVIPVALKVQELAHRLVEIEQARVSGRTRVQTAPEPLPEPEPEPFPEPDAPAETRPEAEPPPEPDPWLLKDEAPTAPPPPPSRSTTSPTRCHPRTIVPRSGSRRPTRSTSCWRQRKRRRSSRRSRHRGRIAEAGRSRGPARSRPARVVFAGSSAAPPRRWWRWRWVPARRSWFSTMASSSGCRPG